MIVSPLNLLGRTKRQFEVENRLQKGEKVNEI